LNPFLCIEVKVLVCMRVCMVSILPLFYDLSIRYFGTVPILLHHFSCYFLAIYMAGIYIYLWSQCLHTWRCALGTTLCNKIRQWLAAVGVFFRVVWFPLQMKWPPWIYDIAEQLLKVALNTITLTLYRLLVDMYLLLFLRKIPSNPNNWTCHYFLFVL
jgi:hypothetical protein